MLTLSLLHGWWDTNPAELHVICVATWKTRATACPYAMPYSRMVAVASLKGRSLSFRRYLPPSSTRPRCSGSPELNGFMSLSILFHLINALLGYELGCQATVPASQACRVASN